MNRTAARRVPDWSSARWLQLKGGSVCMLSQKYEKLVVPMVTVQVPLESPSWVGDDKSFKNA